MEADPVHAAARLPPPAATDTRWLCLPAVPESSARCRDFVRSVFHEWGLERNLDDALLLVSELSSNVVRHAGTPMVVGLAWDHGAQTLRVSVRDDAGGVPTVRGADAFAPSGRGLRMVMGLAQHWGVHQLPVGKIVWFELRVDAPADSISASRARLSADREAQT